MKKKFLLLLCVLFIACGTSKNVYTIKKLPPLPIGTIVEVLSLGQTIPENAEFLGSVKIGDSGFTTECSYEEVVAEGKIEARKIGGNLIVVKKHKTPDIWSSCHRITFEVYKKQ